MKKTFILLPPSEGKQSGGQNNFSHLNPESKELIKLVKNEIKKTEIKTLEKAFKVKGKNLDEALYLIENILNEKTFASIKRFSGVMFKSIDYESLTKEQKENFNNNILFIDGLFGILKPKDKIPNYKLPIDAKINNLKIDKFWEEKLEKQFKELFSNSIVIDILPQAHRKVLNIPKSCEYYTITFCELKNNKLKQSGHLSKKLKGELIRYLSKYEKINRDSLEKFSHNEGFIYSKEFSNNKNIIYLKT